MTGHQADVEAWDRRRLLILLGSVVAVVLLLVVGLVYAVWSIVDDGASKVTVAEADNLHEAGPDGVRGEAYRDDIAAADMLATTASDLQPAPPALEAAEVIEIGSATTLGPADVPTGFDHTPEGAVAQLAAIDIAALRPMSVQAARDIHAAWAAAGAEFSQWEVAASIQAFHASAGTIDGDTSIRVSVLPAAGQVKGTDGPDWALACVLLDVKAVLVGQTRFGYGHCERMQWQVDRWVIASGAKPALAPSTWPGSQRSLDAGWQTWAETGEDH